MLSNSRSALVLAALALAASGALYGAYSAYTFVTGYDTSAPQFSVSTPALNQAFYDNAYGTRLTRVTHASQVNDRDVPVWIRHEYSRRPAFNADGSRMIVQSSNGWFRLYAVDRAGNTVSFVRTLPFGSAEPNWHPTDPDRLYFLSRNGRDMRIHEYSVASNSHTVARDMAAQVRAIFPDAGRVFTRGEGRPSDDGRVWCLQVETSGSGILGLIAYDFTANTILGSMPASERPDHISTSPSGKFCVPSWASGGLGTRAYTVDFSQTVQLHSKSEHSDLATSASGKDAYVFFDYDSGHVAMSEFEQNASGALIATRTNLFPIYGPNSSATSGHVSGTAKRRPGYAVVSFYRCRENRGSAGCSDSQWFKNKVVIVRLTRDFDPEQDLYNLVHTNYANAGYFSETHAVASADLSKILFASTWGSTSISSVASYMVDVPVEFLDGDPPAPPPADGQSLLSTQTPTWASRSDGPNSHYELGMRFLTTQPGEIKAIRFYKAAGEQGATHTGKIYRSDRHGPVLLASVDFENETASGWQEQALDTPLTIKALTEYIVAVNTGNTYYVITEGGLGEPVNSGDMRSMDGPNGVFRPQGTYAWQSWNDSNYFRDVVFVPAQ